MSWTATPASTAKSPTRPISDLAGRSGISEFRRLVQCSCREPVLLGAGSETRQRGSRFEIVRDGTSNPVSRSHYRENAGLRECSTRRAGGMHLLGREIELSGHRLDFGARGLADVWELDRRIDFPDRRGAGGHIPARATNVCVCALIREFNSVLIYCQGINNLIWG